MVRIIDIKAAGLSQDLKELKSDKGFSKALSSQISKIKSEGRDRENIYSNKIKETTQFQRRHYFLNGNLRKTSKEKQSNS